MFGMHPHGFSRQANSTSLTDGRINGTLTNVANLRPRQRQNDQRWQHGCNEWNPVFLWNFLY
jgi:hypothetical protein